MKKKWSGSALFVAILLVLGLTVGVKLYRSGLSLPAATTSTQQANPGSQVKTPAPSTATPTPTPAGASPPTTPATSVSTVNGNVEQTPYGPVQVSVTFAGKSITGVKELQAPNDRERSVEINRYAEPILRNEVLKSQTGHVDTVSGATYTSEGYARSVQSAIDRL
jgi:hypothetical protein